jgi:hypothetical protein
MMTQTDAAGTTVLNFSYPAGTTDASFAVRGAVAALPETVAHAGGKISNGAAGADRNIAAAVSVSWADAAGSAVGTPVTCVNRNSQSVLKKVDLMSQWYDGASLKKMVTATYRSQYASGS